MVNPKSPKNSNKTPTLPPGLQDSSQCVGESPDSLLTAGPLMPRRTLSLLDRRSGGTTSAELHWRLTEELESARTGSPFALQLDKLNDAFLTTGLLR